MSNVIRRTLETTAGVCKICIPAITEPLVKFVNFINTAFYRLVDYRPKVSPHLTHKRPTKNSNTRITGVINTILVSGYFGLLSICGLLILILFLKMSSMKEEIDHWKKEIAETKSRLTKIEKNTQQTAVITNKQDSANSAHIPLALSKADIMIIRQTIKILPPKPGTQQKIHVGDAILNRVLVPVPESLVEQLPILRGARFSIDQNGAIIISVGGSDRADAVIDYQTNNP